MVYKCISILLFNRLMLVICITVLHSLFGKTCTFTYGLKNKGKQTFLVHRFVDIKFYHFAEDIANIGFISFYVLKLIKTTYVKKGKTTTPAPPKTKISCLPGLYLNHACSHMTKGRSTACHMTWSSW